MHLFEFSSLSPTIAIFSTRPLSNSNHSNGTKGVSSAFSRWSSSSWSHGCWTASVTGVDCLLTDWLTGKDWLRQVRSSLDHRQQRIRPGLRLPLELINIPVTAERTHNHFCIYVLACPFWAQVERQSAVATQSYTSHSQVEEAIMLPNGERFCLWANCSSVESYQYAPLQLPSGGGPRGRVCHSDGCNNLEIKEKYKN